MNTTRNYLFAVFSVSLFIYFFSSCVKEGPAGQDGTDGEDGIDGEDGTASCIQCHDNTEVILSKTIQWESSHHAIGETFVSNTKECAPCHTSQGFHERMETGEQTTAGTIHDGNPVNCYTCHWIHKDHELTDWDLTYSNAVELWQSTNTNTTNLGKGNLCANCHQAISPDPMPVPDGDSVLIATSDWGLHFGPVANMITASGGYEIGEGYESSSHATEIENSCIECHLSTPVANKAGGHQMGMYYENNGQMILNISGCIDCHEDEAALDLLVSTTKDDIKTLLDQLEVILLNQNVMDSSFKAKTGEWSADQAGALLNFNMVRYDNSFGIHNYKYTRTLLLNSIESLQ